MPLPSDIGALPLTNARQATYNFLLDAIVFGPLEPGEPLRDLAIAQLLGVSRTPVREALLQLSEEGLVDIQAGRRTRVAPLRFDRAAELYAIAGVLDGLAAELAARAMSASTLAQLDALVDRMSRTTDPGELQILDEQFHGTYQAAAGNQALGQMLRSITVELRRYDRVGFRNPTIAATATTEHRAIFDALLARDASRASAQARFNWTHSWAQLVAVFKPADLDPGRLTTRSDASDGGS